MARSWLNDFSTSISVQVVMLISIGLAVLLLAWLTVGLQTMQAANLDPAKVLKEE